MTETLKIKRERIKNYVLEGVRCKEMPLKSVHCKFEAQ